MPALPALGRLRSAIPGRRRRGHLARLLGAAAIGVESIAVGRLGYPPAGNVVVRCRRGHVFTTIWVAGASVKSLRLGWWRFQWCPAGRHWTLVTPVRRADLSRRERRRADRTRDLRVP